MFGTYNPLASTDALATLDHQRHLLALTPYTISLNDGNYASGGLRRMGSGASRLTYELYRDVGLTGVVGLASASLGVSGVGTGVTLLTTVFGKIPKNQVVTPGG